MKKNEREIKAEVIKYIEETSKHVFEYKKNRNCAGSYFTVRLSEDKEDIFILSQNIVTALNINKIISCYDDNAKCVIKHELFLKTTYNAEPMTAIRQTKYVKAEVEELFLKFTDRLKQKIEFEKAESLRRIQENAERARRQAIIREQQEYEMYLKLKAKFEPQNV